MNVSKRPRRDEDYRRPQRDEPIVDPRKLEEEREEWDHVEEEFYLKQTKVRAQIRVQENRARPIDSMILITDTDYYDADSVSGDLVKLFNNLNLEEAEDLWRDLDFFVRREPSNGDYWKSLLSICVDKVEQLRRAKDPKLQASVGVSPVIEQEIFKLLEGQTLSQLADLRKSVERKLCSDEAIDVEYWQCLLKNLDVAVAKVKVRAAQQQALLRKLAKAQEVEHRRREIEARNKATANAMNATTESGDKISQIERLRQEELDKKELGIAGPSRAISADSLINWDNSPAALQMYETEKNRIADEDEEVFNHDLPVTRNYPWAGTCPPRKPRFFNRVFLGFEWNKYNQKHYDADNLPPKMVRGYRFSIFYPDLVDKSRAPTYILQKDADPEFVIIRFKAGAPYEDIAFRIVNREWEQSHKHGFRCSFERGVLQLFFHVKRFRYRR